MATWGEVKAQARDFLGIALTDFDVGNVPLLRTDDYGNYIPGANGLPQIIIGIGPDGIPNTDDDIVVEGNLAAPVDPTLVGALRTDVGFLVDILQAALNDGMTPSEAEADGVEILNEWLDLPVTTVPGLGETDTLPWNSERIFQAAKLGTEMQYQHLVFEDFARKIQPGIDFFVVPDGYHADINPSILAEFAHVVYRQFNEGLGSADPATGGLLTPDVVRDVANN